MHCDDAIAIANEPKLLGSVSHSFVDNTNWYKISFIIYYKYYGFIAIKKRSNDILRIKPMEDQHPSQSSQPPDQSKWALLLSGQNTRQYGPDSLL